MLDKCGGGGAAASSKGGKKHNFVGSGASASGASYPFTSSKSTGGRLLESANLTLRSDDEVEAVK
jgi:hypothetical protein